MVQKCFSKLSSDTISALRFPLMVGIVFIHFSVNHGITVQGVEYGTNPPFWLAGINFLLSRVFPTIGVPLFFLISGYFFSIGGLTENTYKRRLKKRAKTLLIPYLLWNIVAILYGLVKQIPAVKGFFPNTIFEWSFQRLLFCFWDGNRGLFGNYDDIPVTWMNPADSPLWFVRDLMIVMVLSPIIHWALRKFGWLFVVCLGLAWFIFVRLPLGHANYLLAAFFFFSWGSCYAVKDMDFVASMRKFRPALLIYPLFVIAECLTVALGLRGRSLVHNVGIIMGIFAAVGITNWLMEKRKIRKVPFLADSSFFLFALHMIFIGDLAKVIAKFTFIDSPIYMAALYFLVPIVDICICLGVYWVLRRYTPRICALLTGGR